MSTFSLENDKIICTEFLEFTFFELSLEMDRQTPSDPKAVFSRLIIFFCIFAKFSVGMSAGSLVSGC